MGQRSNPGYTNEIPEREFESVHPEKNVHNILLSGDAENVAGDIQIIPLWKWLLHEPNVVE